MPPSLARPLQAAAAVRHSARSIGTHAIRGPIAALFPGQGSQYVGMGKELAFTFAPARRVFDEANAALGFDLTSVMYKGPTDKLTSTSYAQPAILATSAALLAVLKEEADFDVHQHASYVLGHSLGEYTALYAAGSLSLADAVRLVHQRGKAMEESLPNGVHTSMVALIMRPNKLAELARHVEEKQHELAPGEVVDLSNVNSSTQAVLSGTHEAVERVCKSLQAARIAARAVELPVSAPFHCRLMRGAAEYMREPLRHAPIASPRVPVISNVTVRPHATNDPAAIADLLVQQITDTVRWHQGVEYCRTQGKVRTWIAFGPNRVLANLVKKDYPTDRVVVVESIDDIEAAVRLWR